VLGGLRMVAVGGTRLVLLLATVGGAPSRGIVRRLLMAAVRAPRGRLLILVLVGIRLLLMVIVLHKGHAMSHSGNI
jgi:hypothetical protein